MDNVPIDDTEICPACQGSGRGAAGAYAHCGFCGGDGLVPRAAAQAFNSRQRVPAVSLKS